MFDGARLREVRIAKGFTQEALGDMVGVTKGSISLYESGKRIPKLETMLEFIYPLGVSADYLLGADVIVEVKDLKDPKYRVFTKDEVRFIEILRKDDFLYNVLFQNPKEGIEIIKHRL